jgi:hypothetical protein
MSTLPDTSWSLLLERISNGRCTPFLGAGACAPTLPLGSAVAEELPKRAAQMLKKACEYPFAAEKHDLTAVSQWLAVLFDPPWVKTQVSQIIRDSIERIGLPKFERADEIHGVLARFPLPIYLTTNYDSFMFEALRWAAQHATRSNIEPQAEYCRWHRNLRTDTIELPAVRASNTAPLVYHLHGWLREPNTMVLTEEDYEDFIVELSVNKNLIPHQVMRAISDTALLFVGYSLRDWNLRVLLRAVVKSVDRNLRMKGVTVQLDPGDYSADARSYLESKFDFVGLEVYWGSSAQFADELMRKWRERNGTPGPVT